MKLSQLLTDELETSDHFRDLNFVQRGLAKQQLKKVLAPNDTEIPENEVETCRTQIRFLLASFTGSNVTR